MLPGPQNRAGQPTSRAEPCWPTRRKVTVACEACRKRRIKCTGVLPCDFCVDNKRQCKIDETNRARRGPRPRQGPKTQAQAPRSLLPAPQKGAYEQSVSSTSAVIAEEDKEGVAEDSSEDDEVREGGGGGGGGPEISSLKPFLEEILFAGQRANTRADKTTLGLVCHLLEIHWQRTNVRLRKLFSPELFLPNPNIERCRRHLVFAVCACSVRYSVHALARPSTSGDLGLQLEKSAREEINTRYVDGDDLAQLQSYCFLAEHSIIRGDARRAWLDIALARGLIQVIQGGHDLPDEYQRQIMKSAARYLSLAEALVCLGNPSLLSTVENGREHGQQGTPHDELLDRLLVLRQIQHLCNQGPPRQDAPPWALKSPFRGLQEELEAFLIQGPGAPILTQDLPDLESLSYIHESEASASLLLCHSSIILLNRTFLPIPDRRKDPGAGGGTSITNINFPLAPDLFIRERIRRCEASAAAICEICKDMISNQQFFLQLPWVGLSCTQSALVLINQLHRKPRPPDPEVVENLKFAFTILHLLKQFLAPARQWIDMLFRVHDINTPLTHKSAPIEDAFAGFFSRYANVEDVGVFPLSFQHAPGVTSLQRSSTREAAQPACDEAARSTSPVAQKTWVDVYTDQLDFEASESEDHQASGPPGSHGLPKVADDVQQDARPAADRTQATEDGNGHVETIPAVPDVVVIPENALPQTRNSPFLDMFSMQRGAQSPLFPLVPDLVFDNNAIEEMASAEWSDMICQELSNGISWDGDWPEVL